MTQAAALGFAQYMNPWEGSNKPEELCHGRTLQSSSCLLPKLKELGKEKEQMGSIESSLDVIHSYAEVIVTILSQGDLAWVQ